MQFINWTIYYILFALDVILYLFGRRTTNKEGATYLRDINDNFRPVIALKWIKKHA